MKFKQYLDEKITKKEFDEALKNINIKAGCEFEFYLDDGSFSVISERDVDRFVRESDKEIDNINSNINDYNDAVEEVRALRKELETKNEKLDYKMEKAEAEVERLKSENDDLEIDMMGDSETKIIKSQIQQNLKGIKKLQDIIDDDRRKYDDNYDTIESIENGEYTEDLVYEYNPYPYISMIPTFFELVEYLIDNGYYIENLRDDKYNEKLFDEYERYGKIGDTNNLFNTFFGYYLNDLLNENPEGGIPDEDAIMDMGFPYNLNKPGWEAKEDGSLNSDGNGIEIVTPIEPLPELIKIIEKVFKWMEKVGHTNSDCGFHVHMSLNKGHEIDPLKLLLFMEEGLIYKNFEERIGNSYAVSIKKGHIDKMEPFTVDNIKTLAKKDKLDKEMNTAKYMGIHLIELEKNHVEFRYMGGNDYHKKFKNVREVIANYAHWLSIACDPDYKRKEYLQKANRLTNYFNALYLNRIIDAFTGIAESDVNDKDNKK